MFRIRMPAIREIKGDRPASRGLGKHTKGDRRDAGLKMGWTKSLPRAWPMGIDYRLDLGR